MAALLRHHHCMSLMTSRIRSLSSLVVRGGIHVSYMSKNQAFMATAFDNTLLKTSPPQAMSHRFYPSLREPMLIQRRWMHERRGYTYFKQHGAALRHNKKAWLLTLIIPALGLYYVIHLDTVPISGRRRFLAVSESMELKIGENTFKQIMNEVGNRILPRNDPTVCLVNRVGNRIVAAADMSPSINWEFFVIDSPEKNCFVIPGGKVFVYTGILPILKDEAGLAVVLGHEIAHAKARHAGEKLSFVPMLMILKFCLNLFFDVPEVFQSIIYSLVLELPFSRSCEEEADFIGLMITAKACYNPDVAIKVWENMDRLGGPSSHLHYLSTHPSNTNRIAAIKGYLEQAREEMQRSCSYRSSFDQMNARRLF